MVADTVVRTSLTVDTLTIPTYSVEYVDTTYCPPGLADTLIVTKQVVRWIPADTIVREIPCIDTVIVHRDAERVAYFQQQLEITRQELKEAKNKTPFLQQVAKVLTLLIVLGGVFLVARVLGLFA